MEPPTWDETNLQVLIYMRLHQLRWVITNCKLIYRHVHQLQSDLSTWWLNGEHVNKCAWCTPTCEYEMHFNQYGITSESTNGSTWVAWLGEARVGIRLEALLVIDKGSMAIPNLGYHGRLEPHRASGLGFTFLAVAASGGSLPLTMRRSGAGSTVLGGPSDG